MMFPAFLLFGTKQQPAAKARSVNSDNTFNYDRRAQRRWNEDY